jgi:GNAT superfamily N-acetyltransferase
MTEPVPSFEVRAVDAGEIDLSVDILEEAAVWGGSDGRTTWPLGWFLDPTGPGRARLHKDVASGSLYIVWLYGTSAATFALLDADPMLWPAAADDALYLHRFAVRRSAAGVGRRAIAWMVDEVRRRGRSYLRLDCREDNPGIRSYYERCGFTAVGETTTDRLRLSLYELAVPADGASAQPHA